MSIYARQKIVDRRGNDVAAMPRQAMTRFGKVETTAEPLVGKNGEYNAASKKVLINTIQFLTDQLGTGNYSKVAEVDDAEATNRLVTAALNERHADLKGGAFERVGQVVSEMISETMGRLGFSDKILGRVDVKEGGIARVEIDQMDVVAWHLVANGNVAESLTNPKFIYPEGYWIQSLIYVEEQDLFFAGSSFLERKYQTGLQAMLVREDNVTKFLLDQAAPIANNLVTFGSFTPTVFGVLRDQVWRWGLNPTTCLLAVDLQRDILADDDWHNVYSPVEKHVLFQEGKFGEIFGVEVFTDGYRYDTLRVLNQGEIYILGAPQTLGAKVPMIPMYSEPVNRHFEGIPKKGWFLAQFQATVIANSKAVSYGVKV